MTRREDLGRRRAIPLHRALRLLNSGATVLVSSAAGRRRSVLAIAWQMPASKEPPLVVVSIAPGRYSAGVIQKARAFAINVPTVDQLALVRRCGRSSGWQVDKFSAPGLTARPGRCLPVPWVEECPAHLECRLVRTHRCGDHRLFVGEIVAASAAAGFFRDHLRVDQGVRTLHHLGGAMFHLPGRVVSM